jgi:ferrous iron transport protein A
MIAIQGGHTIRKRLSDLGLTPGTVLQIVQANAHGPLIIAVKNDARLVLGRGMAHKIQVEPVSQSLQEEWK